jgi:hypothetical protein
MLSVMASRENPVEACAAPAASIERAVAKPAKPSRAG